MATNLVKGATGTVPEGHVKKPVTSKPTDNQQEFKLVNTPNAGKEFLLAIRELAAFDDTPINAEDVRTAMRKIDENNMASLLQAEEKDIPPIWVQQCNGIVDTYNRKTRVRKWIIVSGYHRYNRIIRLTELNYRESKGKLPKDSEGNFIRDLKADNLPELTDEEETELDAAIRNAKIRCVAVNAQSIEDLVMMAANANSSHGLPSNKSFRSRYAYWLIAVAVRQGKSLSMREAARQAKVSHVAMIYYARAKKRAEEKDSVVPVKTEQQIEQDLRDKFDKACEKLAKDLRAVYELVKDSDRKQAIEAVGVYFDLANDSDMLLAMSDLLANVADEEQFEEEEEEAGEEEEEEEEETQE